MPSIAACVWNFMFVRRLGIAMPHWLVQYADALCTDNDDVTHIVNAFASVCPIAVAQVDKAFMDEVTEAHAQLRVQGVPPDVELGVAREPLCLDGRTHRDPSGRCVPADVCANPVLMMELLHATVVYVDAGASLELAGETVAALSDAGHRLCVVCAASAPNVTAYLDAHERTKHRNISVYYDHLTGKDFTAAFPKVCAHFVCVTSWARVSAGAHPDGGNRFTYRNLLIAPYVADEKRVPALSTGFGRVLCVDRLDNCAEHVVPEAGRCVVYSLPNDDAQLFAETLLQHMRYDGSENARSMLSFTDNMIKGHAACVRGLEKKRAVTTAALMAIETRACPVLVLNLTRTAWATGVNRVLLLLATADATVHAFYKRHLKPLKASVVQLPQRAPFMRAKPFAMTAYNRMVTSPEFWTLVRELLPAGATSVICVQDDGTFLRKVPRDMVRRWINDYDYIGAPWSPTNLPDLKRLVPGMVGNGGLSLRNVQCMLQCADAGKGDVRDCLYENRFDMPEDVFFCHVMTVTGKRLAPKAVAQRFAMEQVRDDDAYAIHKPWLYHPFAVVDAIMATANLELGIVSPETSSWISS